MLKTHTGATIYVSPNSYSCGAWLVAGSVVRGGHPGRARQMRRMLAKARRRVRRAGGLIFVIRANMPPEQIKSFRDYFEQMVCRNESITVPPGDYSEPFVLPEGARLPTPEMSPRARVGVRRGTDPEVEAAFRASVATSVPDDAKVDLAGGE